MSSIGILPKNKKRFTMYLSIAFAISLWFIPIDLSAIDLTNIWKSTPVTLLGFTLFLAMLLYRLPLDELIDRQLKKGALYGAWREEGDELSFLRRSIALINIYLSPWYSSDWVSLDDDCDKFLDIAISDEKIQQTLWENKLGIAGGISITIAFSKIVTSIDPLLAIVAILTGVTVILTTILRKEVQGLPKRVQKLAAYQYLTNASQNILSRFSDSADDICVPIVTWMRKTHDDCQLIKKLIDDGSWNLFETKLQFSIRFVESQLYSNELRDYLRKELTNTYIMLFSGSSTSEDDFDSEMEDLEATGNEIYEDFEIAYEYTPPDWLWSWLFVQSMRDLVALFEKINLEHIEKNTMNKLASFFVWGNKKVLWALLQTMADSPSDVRFNQHLKETIYNFYNDNELHQEVTPSKTISEFILLHCYDSIIPSEIERQVLASITASVDDYDQSIKDRVEDLFSRVIDEGNENYSARYFAITNFPAINKNRFTKKELGSKLANLKTDIISDVETSNYLYGTIERFPIEFLQQPELTKALMDRESELVELANESYFSLAEILHNRGIAFILQIDSLRKAIEIRFRKRGPPLYGLDVVTDYFREFNDVSISNAVESQIDRLCNDIVLMDKESSTIDKITEITWLMQVPKVTKAMDKLQKTIIRESRIYRSIQGLVLFLLIGLTVVFGASYYGIIPQLNQDVFAAAVICMIFGMYIAEALELYRGLKRGKRKFLLWRERRAKR